MDVNATNLGWFPLSSQYRGRVGQLIPNVFERYVRVLHPATKVDGTRERWSEVARANGRVVHGAMEWSSIVGDGARDAANDRTDVVEGPAVGCIPADVAQVVEVTLRRHTSTPAACTFAVWDGYNNALLLAEPKVIEIGDRRYFGFVGDVGEAIANLASPPFVQRANYWWPADLSWCVCTDIDLMSTYVGCSTTAAGELLAAPELETFAVPIEQKITWDADVLNPVVRPD